MKKKFIYFILFCLLVLSCLLIFNSCKDSKQQNFISYPLKEIEAIYDSQGNLLQQTIYNEITNEYIIKEFTYSLQENMWVCTNQQSYIITKNTDTPKTTNSILNIYYKSDLSNSPVVIMSNEYVKISIVEYLSSEQWWEFGYKVEITNKTDKVITVIFDTPTIMNIQCDPVFDIEHINAGDTVNFTLAWDKDTLERCYIPYIDNVGFMLKIYDNENWTSPALAGRHILIKN